MTIVWPVGAELMQAVGQTDRQTPLIGTLRNYSLWLPGCRPRDVRRPVRELAVNSDKGVGLSG